MALKRKASFTTITSPSSHNYYNLSSSPCASPIPISFLGTATITVDEPPRHLHSRTRKRFRNDRPDEQSIYDKTLQWLFSAQRKQSSAQPENGNNKNNKNNNNSLEIISPSAPAEIPQQPSIDPNQQTLQRFFQPVRASHTSSHVQSQSHTQCQEVKKAMHPATQPLASNGISIHHSTSASADGTGMDMGMDIDMDVDMDVDCAGIEGFVPVAVSMGPPMQGRAYEQGKRWVGGIGWM
ncbi:hypothetical protein AJ78_02873 [Emergomyces pasteurianus Ep9510]|uniref:Uncharacterized protein n=1 Tax=Emergomyces pasteurianus Ep9510 TaxID=1447872 RepID=A0A1J9PKF8_9EURO|nr:hypothetical protein AJ78_02873 [Emergomyces pasteurianus Ep9510]